MSLGSEKPKLPSELSQEKRASILPNEEINSDFVNLQKTDIKNLLPSQVDTGSRLEERQETTRSQLATLLIKILAGTLAGSFSLIILLTIMSGFIDQNKSQSFDKTSSLVKDLITFILTAQTGLIGTALGFYFGSRGNNTD